MSYLKRICDSVQHLPMLRADDNAAIYARHLVTATLQELFRFEYRRTKWASGELLSFATNIDPGAREVSWMEMGNTGTADIVADSANDIPTADIEGQLNINRAYTIATAIQFSTQDIRASRMQGLFDIASEKAQAAREAHDRKLDELVRLGDVSKGITGITDVSGSFHVTATTGAWGTSASAAQIQADFQVAWDAIYNGTEGVEEPDTCVLPSTVWGRLNSLQNSVASDATVLDFLKRSHPNITLWTPDAGLNTAGDAGDAAVMLYSRDRTRVRGLMPLALRPLPLEQHGLVAKMVFESRYAGLAVPRPKSIAKISGV